jgi:hypothetical protein
MLKLLISTKAISKLVFGKHYVGGHWIEIVFCETDEGYIATDYCSLEIGYDFDKIYLLGTNYDEKYIFKYNLETGSASMTTNYELSYTYKYVGGKESRKGYGTIAFHTRGASTRPERYTGIFQGDNSARVEGFLIKDKATLKELSKNFIPTFKKLINEKKEQMATDSNIGECESPIKFFATIPTPTSNAKS